MLFFTVSNIWSISFFFTLTYITFIFSTITYFLPNLNNNNNTIKNKSNFYFISTYETIYFLVSPILSVLIIINLWSSNNTSSWFGHIVYTSFQYKMSLFILLTFIVLIYLYSSVTYISSKEIYDFIITIFNFMYWIMVLFFTNSKLIYLMGI